MKTALEAALVYPVWLRFPLTEAGGAIGLDAAAPPRGVLLVTVHSCTNLKVPCCEEKCCAHGARSAMRTWCVFPC